MDCRARRRQGCVDPVTQVACGRGDSVKREALVPVSCSHQRLPSAANQYAQERIASQTLVSGKLNEFISFFMREADAAPSRANQRRVENEPPTGPSRPGLSYYTLNPRENQFADRTALRAAASWTRR
jgi:hypothetical protein